MKECPFSYSRAGYKNCQTSSCALWHSASGKCSITAIADFLYSKKPSCSTSANKKTNCLMCDNYGGHKKCKMAAAVCESNDMKTCCRYYREKED